MYELTCPACQNKSQHAFVRVGARVSCQQCQHTYQLGNEQIVPLKQIPSEDSTNPNPLLFGSPVTKPPAPAHPSHASKPTRKQESHRSSNAPPPLMTPEQDPTLHPEPKPKPPAEVQRMIAQRRAQRERKRIIIRIIIGILSFCLPAALLLYMFMMARQIEDTPSKSDDGTTLFQNVTPNSQINMDNPNLITVKAERLASPFWHLVNLPYEATDAIDQIILEPGNWVNRDDLNKTYVAHYTVHSPESLELVILHLSLVDSQNRIFATNQIPLTLLMNSTFGVRSNGTLNINVPIDLATRAIRVVSKTQVIQTMGNSVAMREPMVESQIDTEDAKLFIAAYNPLNKPLRRCVFSIIAIDKQNNELAHWRVNWQRIIDPKQRVEFIINLPISKFWTIGGWKLIAFGETATISE